MLVPAFAEGQSLSAASLAAAAPPLSARLPMGGASVLAKGGAHTTSTKLLPVESAVSGQDLTGTWRALEAKCSELVDKRVQQMAHKLEEAFNRRIADLEFRLDSQAVRSRTTLGPQSSLGRDLGTSTKTILDIDSTLKALTERKPRTELEGVSEEEKENEAEFEATLLAGLASVQSELASATERGLSDFRAAFSTEQQQELQRWRQRTHEEHLRAHDMLIKMHQHVGAGNKSSDIVERLEVQQSALQEAMVFLQSLSLRLLQNVQQDTTPKASDSVSSSMTRTGSVKVILGGAGAVPTSAAGGTATGVPYTPRPATARQQVSIVVPMSMTSPSREMSMTSPSREEVALNSPGVCETPGSAWCHRQTEAITKSPLPEQSLERLRADFKNVLGCSTTTLPFEGTEAPLSHRQTVFDPHKA